MGLRGRHARLHGGRHSGVRRQKSGRRATPSPPCQRSPTASTSTGPSAAPTGRTGSSNCARDSSRRLLDPKREGAVRVLSLRESRAHGRLSRVGAAVSSPARSPRPTSRKPRRFGAVKYGFGLNTEQEVTDSLRLFARFGWNEDQHESFAYTEVGQTILFGGDYSGHELAPGERQDRRGVCFQRHQARPPELSALRRAGFSAGRRQPDLRARGHSGVVLQRSSLARTLLATFGGSEIAHPGYNKDRGPVYVDTVRAHIDF